ncbi:GNAT family N-acetyltransferase [Streptomyces zhihengii]
MAVAAEYRGRGIARALLRRPKPGPRHPLPSRRAHPRAPPRLLLPAHGIHHRHAADRAAARHRDAAHPARPYMTAVKPLHPTVRLQPVPGAPGPVVTGLLPGCDLPPTARFGTHVVG